MENPLDNREEIVWVNGGTQLDTYQWERGVSSKKRIASSLWGSEPSREAAFGRASHKRASPIPIPLGIGTSRPLASWCHRVPGQASIVARGGIRASEPLAERASSKPRPSLRGWPQGPASIQRASAILAGLAARTSEHRRERRHLGERATSEHRPSRSHWGSGQAAISHTAAMGRQCPSRSPPAPGYRSGVGERDQLASPILMPRYGRTSRLRSKSNCFIINKPRFSLPFPSPSQGNP